MNFRQMNYLVTLAETLNFSLAAEALGVSQPALSKQIISIEKEFGITLFNRSSVPLTLTPAGEEIVKQCKEMLYSQSQLQSIADEFKNGNKGRLIIGISPFRATYFLNDVILKLREKFTGLEIVLKETGSAELHKMAVEGKVDLAIINKPFDETLLNVIPLCEEKLVLAIPKNVSSKLLKRGIETPTLKNIEEFPFIALSKNQELRQMLNKLCATENVKLNVSVEVNGIATAWNLAQAGIGATVVPMSYAENLKTKNLTLVPLETQSSVRKPAIVTKKGAFLTTFTTEAIKLLKTSNPEVF